jgi:hypothetical protein
MRASNIVLIAIGVFVLGRWAHNQPAITIGTVASAFVLVVTIAMLDHGSTEEIAKGFAWIILAVAVLSDNSPVTPVANLIGSKLANQPLKPGS